MAVMDFIQNTFEKFGRSGSRSSGGKGIGNNMGMAEYDDVRLQAPLLPRSPIFLPLSRRMLRVSHFPSISLDCCTHGPRKGRRRSLIFRVYCVGWAMSAVS